MDILLKGLAAMVVALLGTLLITSLLAFGLDQWAQGETISDPSATAAPIHATSSIGR